MKIIAAEPSRPGCRFSLRMMFVLIAVSAVFAFLGTKFHRFSERLRAEYRTAQTIRRVGEFVGARQGQWPKSWSDIPDGGRLSQYVRMRFDLDTKELIDDPDLSHTVIVPVSGEYRTYPHAHKDLEHLREILATFDSSLTPGP